jgi:hypothetical protein
MDGSASNSPHQTCVCGKRLVGVHVTGPVKDDSGMHRNGFTWSATVVHVDGVPSKPECIAHIKELGPAEIDALLSEPEALHVREPGAPF